MIYVPCMYFRCFFGIIRQSCGGNDHPTPNQFLYAYRLLSISNLVKPGRRSSVQANPTNVLLTMKSIKPQHELLPFVPQIEIFIDEIFHDQSQETTGTNSEHDYRQSDPEECITFYLGGYVAHKLMKFTSCQQCTASLTSTQLSAESKFVEIKTMGGLKLPSHSLTQLIKFLEACFQKFSAKPSTNIYNDVLNEVLCSDKLSKCGIGCENHLTSLTARCIHFYIATRLHFLKKSMNKNRVSSQKKHKLSKISKLT